MATKSQEENSDLAKKHPDRHYYSFYLTKHKKKEILALVELGIAPNGNQLIKTALEIHIDKYRHLIRPEIMKQVEDKYFSELANPITDLKEV